jgi:hypothetical protein
VIGEDAMNDALSVFVGRWRFKGPPYATSRDLLAELRRVTPAAQQSLIEDFFETITLYDDRAVSAKAHKRPDGKYDVDLVVSAKKIRADAAGNEQETPLDAMVDIGVLDAAGNPLFLEKRRVRTGENRFALEVAGLPARAGIDLLDKLIDREASDNLVAVTFP